MRAGIVHTRIAAAANDPSAAGPNRTDVTTGASPVQTSAATSAQVCGPMLVPDPRTVIGTRTSATDRRARTTGKGRVGIRRTGAGRIGTGTIGAWTIGAWTIGSGVT